MARVIAVANQKGGVAKTTTVHALGAAWASLGDRVQLVETIDDVRGFTNPELRIAGVIATMFDGRTNEGRRVLEGVAEQTGLTVLEPPIPRSVRFAEAPAKGRSIFEYAPNHPGAEAY